MLLESYLNHIQLQEGYIFSGKTISVDLDKFESGESNKLIVVGLSGGGKSSLSMHLAKKYNCYHNETDICSKQSLSQEEYLEFIMNPKSASNVKIFKHLYINCFKPALLSNKKEILDGPIFQSYALDPSTRPLINKYPVIILGKSALRSVWDRTQRTLRKQYAQEKYNTKKDIYEKYKRGLILNFKYLQKYLNQFKELRIKSGGNVQELKVPMLDRKGIKS
jgi:adenylate kinase family enzyme